MISDSPPCPFCEHREAEGHVCATGDQPLPATGDCALCANCGRLAIYQQTAWGMNLRKPTDAEQEAMRHDPKIQSVLQVLAGEAPSLGAALWRHVKGHRRG